MAKSNRLTLGARLRNAVAAVFGPTIRTDNLGSDGIEWFPIGPGARTSSGQLVTQQIALGLPVVYACIRVLANTIGPLPIHLVKESDDGRTRERVTDHPVAALLVEPNSAGGFGMNTLMKTSQTHYQLGGEDFMQIERDEFGFPVRLWPLDSSTQTLVDQSFGGRRGIVGYRTTIQGQSRDLPPGDVIHSRNLSLDGITPISPIRAAAEAIGVGLAIDDFVGAFYENYCMTGGYFTHPGKLSDKAQKNFLDSVDDQGRDKVGTRQHFKPVVLEEGVKYQPVTVTPQAAEMKSSRNSVKEDVAGVYGVPLILLQIVEGSTVWGTGIETLLIAFTQTCIVPIVTQYEDEMTRKLLTVEERLEGYRVRFDLSALLRGDSKSLAEANNMKITNGSKTINEARQDDGLNPVPWGDKPPEKPSPAAAAPPKQKDTATNE